MQGWGYKQAKRGMIIPQIKMLSGCPCLSSIIFYFRVPVPRPFEIITLHTMNQALPNNGNTNKMWQGSYYLKGITSLGERKDTKAGN